MRELFSEVSKVIHVVKSICLRSITIKYGAYTSILAYATYKLELNKNGATKCLDELQEYVEQANIGDDVRPMLFEIIEDTYKFVEVRVVTRGWTEYVQSVRELFGKERFEEVKLGEEEVMEYYEDIKRGVEVRVDLVLEQVEKNICLMKTNSLRGID